MKEIMPTTDHLSAPSADEQARFIEQGLTLDQFGRPLHPWRDQLGELEDGKGTYWKWGPNYTVDPVVIAGNNILLIKRRDNGMWALPGGFVDDGETIVEAGRRETLEESGNNTLNDSPEFIYQGPVNDYRARRNAWPETTVLFWRADLPSPLKAGDDAIDAKWMPLNSVRSLPLHGSHNELIDTVIQRYGTPLEQIDYFGDENEVVIPSDGHMGYQHAVVTTPIGTRFFIKRHDPSLFTDPLREAHSRLYLQKEHRIYETSQAITAYLPSTVQLYGDHTLAMEAFDSRDGWLWRAPSETAMRQRYIREILTALQTIATTPITESPVIVPTNTTFHREGWERFPEHRIRFDEALRTSSLSSATELADKLDELYANYQSEPQSDATHFAHHDARQSNIAWHPDLGVRIVDWSWAGAGVAAADSTNFLIDLARTGIDVEPYMHAFNPAHARVLIGFWLEHSTWETPTSDRSVRIQQLRSAIAAFRLLQGLSDDTDCSLTTRSHH